MKKYIAEYQPWAKKVFQHLGFENQQILLDSVRYNPLSGEILFTDDRFMDCVEAFKEDIHLWTPLNIALLDYARTADLRTHTGNGPGELISQLTKEAQNCVVCDTKVQQSIRLAFEIKQRLTDESACDIFPYLSVYGREEEDIDLFFLQHVFSLLDTLLPIPKTFYVDLLNNEPSNIAIQLVAVAILSQPLTEKDKELRFGDLFSALNQEECIGMIEYLFIRGASRIAKNLALDHLHQFGYHDVSQLQVTSISGYKQAAYIQRIERYLVLKYISGDIEEYRKVIVEYGSLLIKHGLAFEFNEEILLFSLPLSVSHIEMCLSQTDWERWENLLIPPFGCRSQGDLLFLKSFYSMLHKAEAMDESGKSETITHSGCTNYFGAIARNILEKNLSGNTTSVLSMFLASPWNDFGINLEDVISIVGKIKPVVSSERLLEYYWLSTVLTGETDIVQGEILALYAQTKDWAGVIETAMWIKEKGSLTTGGALLLARAFIEVSEVEESNRVVKLILENEPANADANLLLGIAYEKSGNVELAVNHIGLAIEIDSLNPDGWLTLAELQKTQERGDLAISVLRRGLEAIPSHPEMSYCLSRVLAEDGQYQAAYLAMIGNEAFFCDNPERFSHYLDLLWETNHIPDLQDAVFGIGERYIQHENVMFHRARLYQLQEKSVVAIEELENFLRKYPAAPFLFDYYFNLLITVPKILSLASGDFSVKGLERVREVILAAISQYPSSVDYEVYLCEIRMLRDEYSEAYETLIAVSKRSVDLEIPLRERVEYDLALCSQALGEFDVAMATFESLLQKHPASINIQMELAETCRLNGLIAQAEKYASKVVDLGSDFCLVIDWYLRFQRDLKIEEDLQFKLDEMNQLYPDSLPIKKALLKIHMEKRNYEWVQGQLEEILHTDIGLLEPDRVSLIKNALESYSLDLATRLIDAGGDSFLLPISALILYISYLMKEHQYGLVIMLAGTYQEIYKNCRLLKVLESDCQFYLGNYDSAEKALLSLQNSEQSIPNNDLQFEEEFLYTQEEVKFHQSPSAIFLRLALVARKKGDINAVREYTEKALGHDVTHPINRYAFTIAVLINQKEEEIDKLKHLLNLWQPELLSEINKDDYLTDFRQNLLGETLFQSSQPILLQETEKFGLAKEHTLKLKSTIQKNRNFQSISSDSLSSVAVRFTEERQSIREFSIEKGISSIFHQFFLDDFWLFRNLPLGEELLSVWPITASLIQEDPALQYTQKLFCDIGVRLLLLNSFYHELDVMQHLPETTFDLVSLEEKITHMMHSLENDDRKSALDPLWSWYQALGSGTAILLTQQEIQNLTPDLQSYYILCARSTETVLPSEQRKSIENEPFAEVMVQIALMNFQQGRILEAWDEIKQAIGLAPHDAVIRYCYAKIAIRLEQYEAGIEGLYTALELWPEETEWHRLAAQNFIDGGRINEASMHLEVLDREGICSSNEKIELAHAYIQQKAFNKASRLIAQIPEDEEYGFQRTALLVLLAVRKGSFDTADSLFKELPCVSELTREAYLSLAEVKLSNGEQGAALNIAQSTYHYSPTHAPTLIFLGKCLVRNGHKDDAVKVLSQIRQDAHTGIQVQRLGLLKQITTEEDFKEEIESVYEKYPDDPDICFFEAKILVEAGENEKAMDLLATILQQENAKAEHHFFAGWLHNELGNLDKAVDHLNLALQKDKNNAEALLLLAEVHLKRRETKKALDAYQKGIQEFDKDYRFYYEAGRLLREMKLYKDAEFMIRKASELAPDRKDIRNQLGAVMALNFVQNAQ